jgi:sec-independent protein translocase protein TatA
MRLPGGWEWIIILIIIVILFGPGRLGKIAGELGRGIREFRSGIQGEDEEEDSSQMTETHLDDDQS